MFRHSRTKRTRGQALVEFTLAATLIFTLLSAAVDLGLIFFTMQTLRTAAQEGATFGSYPVVKLKSDGVSVQAVQLNELGIIDRIRLSSGANPTGFAKMTDLNNDGHDDSAQSSVFDEYITIENPKYPGDQLYDDDGNAVTP
ncbi:MAG: pilus assembly protein, partial [Oscillochloris sp.]|nr:pilus assembly protein [Oscillochloris sp.]